VTVIGTTANIVVMRMSSHKKLYICFAPAVIKPLLCFSANVTACYADDISLDSVYAAMIGLVASV
jgi:hypothetical protein